MTIKHKIAFLYTILTACILFLLGIVVYTFALFYTTEEFFNRLDQRANITAKAHFEKDEVDAEIYKEIRQEYLLKLPEEKEYIFNAPLKQSDLENSQINARLLKETIDKGKAYFRENNLYGTTLKYEDGNDNYVIAITARDIHGFNKLYYLRRTLLISILLSLGLVYTVGYFYSVQLLRPINKTIEEARKIKASNLHHRLQVKKSHQNDELGKLAHTFNDMLSRLETSFELQKKFVSHASHEFKNPLTAILGKIEITLSQNRSAKEYYNTLCSIREESQKLKNITSNLFLLSKISFDNKSLEMQPIRIDELLIDVRNTYVKDLPSGQIKLDITKMPEEPEQITVDGNCDLLRIAFSNLVENGIKFSKQVDIHISLKSYKKNLTIMFTDHGMGIPEKDLPAIFENFYRSENARIYAGHGIGLPLTKNIISIHGGTITAKSTLNMGTTFTVELPHRNA